MKEDVIEKAIDALVEGLSPFSAELLAAKGLFYNGIWETEPDEPVVHIFSDVVTKGTFEMAGDFTFEELLAARDKRRIGPGKSVS